MKTVGSQSKSFSITEQISNECETKSKMEWRNGGNSKGRLFSAEITFVGIRVKLICWLL